MCNKVLLTVVTYYIRSLELVLAGYGEPGGSEGKASACIAGDLGSIPGSGRSHGEGNGNPLQYSCLGKIPWAEKPGKLSPWGCKGSDTTERLHFHFHSTLLYLILL